jgi:nitroreductase
MTEFRDLLRRRRMVRSYLPDPIEPDVTDRILGVVRRAPSAGFSQGHRLIVVTEESRRRELARLAGEDEYVDMGMPRWISVAPVHIVVGVREESYHERYRKDDKLVDGEEITWPAPYWYVDSGSLFMLLQLAALDEGLGAGIYGVAGTDVPELKRLLGMPEDVHFVCVVTVGKRPAEEDDSPLVSRLTQARLPFDGLVRWDRPGS